MGTLACTLITGASSGIGERLAWLAAADRTDVVLVARRADKLQRLADALAREHNVRATVLAVDLARPDAADAIAAGLEARGIEVDVLVNNAGFGTWGPFSQTSMHDERQMIDVNVTALTVLTKRLLPAMLARRHGRILNVASTAAFQPGPLMAVYYATKAYVLSFSEALASELEGTGVTVTCLCPGPTETGFQSRAEMGRSRLFRTLSLMDAGEVARQGYDAMKAGRTLIVTGMMNKLTAQSSRFLPRRVITRATKRINSAE